MAVSTKFEFYVTESAIVSYGSNGEPIFLRILEKSRLGKSGGGQMIVPFFQKWETCPPPPPSPVEPMLIAEEIQVKLSMQSALYKW